MPANLACAKLARFQSIRMRQSQGLIAATTWKRAGYVERLITQRLGYCSFSLNRRSCAWSRVIGSRVIP
jgi:hypothetical protein